LRLQANHGHSGHHLHNGHHPTQPFSFKCILREYPRGTSTIVRFILPITPLDNNVCTRVQEEVLPTAKRKVSRLVGARTDEGKRASNWCQPISSLARQIRQIDATMRLPLEIAGEVGSFLDRRSLTVCTTQLCWGGVEFVSRPSTDSANETMFQLYELVSLCRTASRSTLGVGKGHTNGLANEAIKRIDLCLARRTSAAKIFFVADLTGADGRANADIYSDIHGHYSLSSNLQLENGPRLAVEWHADAKSIDAVAFLLGQSLHTLDLGYAAVNDISALASCQALHTLYLTNTQVSDVSALASCQALHTLYLTSTQVSDVSALTSCQALHTLHLNSTQVSDVSVLASCQALHTLRLFGTQVSDVSALASCQALHTLDLYRTPVSDVSALVACASLRDLHGCEHKHGYEVVARRIEDRRLQAQDL
jgi:Leucine-rich repeat (LRR) protein